MTRCGDSYSTTVRSSCFKASNRLRRAPGLIGKNPSNTNRSVGNPESVNALRRPLPLVMVVQTHQRFANLIALQQLAGLPRILARDQIGGLECFNRPKANVLEISDRRGNHA